MLPAGLKPVRESFLELALPHVRIVNLNLNASERDGCLRLQAALQTLAATEDVQLSVEVVPFAAMQGDRPAAAADGVVLGPQGTPFSRYDAEFLPWLHGFVESATVPVLGVCGGMQALALAYGGRLGSTYGGSIGDDYAGHRKLRGPLPVTLEATALPQWLPVQARTLLAGWQAEGGRVFQSHVEQVASLGAGIPEASPLVAVAWSEPTPIEAFAHRTRPILASQFHPELGWDEGCQAGRLWLRAWLALLS